MQIFVCGMKLQQINERFYDGLHLFIVSFTQMQLITNFVIFISLLQVKRQKILNGYLFISLFFNEKNTFKTKLRPSLINNFNDTSVKFCR